MSNWPESENLSDAINIKPTNHHDEKTYSENENLMRNQKCIDIFPRFTVEETDV